MNNYNEIIKELEVTPIDRSDAEKARSATYSLFNTCQEYLLLNKVNARIEEAKNVLQNYLDEEDCLTKRRQKTDRERMQSLYIPSKLYIEIFWNVYHKHFNDKTEKDFLNEIIYDIEMEKRVDDVLKEIIGESSKKTVSFTKQLKNAISEWTSNYNRVYSLEGLHLQNLHHAMQILGTALKTPEADVADSVEEILTQEKLSLILEYLKAKLYPHVLFTVAPITRALTDGATSSYIPRNTTVFFNLNLEYNLNQLKTYISKLQDLYEEYTEMQTELLEDFKVYL